MTIDSDSMQYPDVANFRQIKGTKLYRSAKLDNLDGDGIAHLQALDIMTVMDLRSPMGWEDTATASNFFTIDSHFQAFSVAFSSWIRNVGDTIGNRRRETSFKLKPLRGRTPKGAVLPMTQGRRLFLNVVEKEFALGLLASVVPWYQIPWIIILMLSFLMCRTRLFLKEFARIVMNPIGIQGQYKAIVKYCGQPIHATLDIISDPANVPSVVCCAQGKDRTGIISALIMAVCGATREEIINEYAASEAHVNRMTQEMQQYTSSYYLSPEFGTAKARTMEVLLDYIDEHMPSSLFGALRDMNEVIAEYGSIENYLESIGFNREKQERLRCNVAA